MTALRITELVCNHPRCGHTFTRYGTSTETRRAARAEGWLTGRPGRTEHSATIDYCDDHAQEYR